MSTTRCDYCQRNEDSRLVKPVDWPEGGVACYACRGTESKDASECANAWKEQAAIAEQDRTDAARWRALRPFLVLTMYLEGCSTRWVELKCVPFLSGGSVDAIVDKLAQIAQEAQQS